ncbi:hypothetical protein [Bradyrhizobium glycinis]|uniref:hypothetical protein n=1 Tax=Bradyrhizobium glycinis TaxID=2751812 RepID=UPI0018D8B91A|nr:hypothetical protein [Bradyrhizobium glycinis]MBH5369911.1 hypothetical protein [Bradyrhizobium glycinis]
MTGALKTIVLKFEAALLDGVRSGADESDLEQIFDLACERLREFNSEARDEAYFSAAIEVHTKFKMALETISRVDAERRLKRQRR